MKVVGEVNDSSAIGEEVRQGCVMTSWLFNIFMGGCVREMKGKVGKIDATLKLNGVDCSVVACLFAFDTVALRVKRNFRGW